MREFDELIAEVSCLFVETEGEEVERQRDRELPCVGVWAPQAVGFIWQGAGRGSMGTRGERGGVGGASRRWGAKLGVTSDRPADFGREYHAMLAFRSEGSQ